MSKEIKYLTDKWFETYLYKYKTRQECVDYLNQSCGLKLRISELREYEVGTRTPNACLQRIMRCDIMIDELKAAGWKTAATKLKGDDLVVLVNVMSLRGTK